MTIYLNAAGHGLPSRATLQRIRKHLVLEEDVGGHAAHLTVSDELEKVRADLASLVQVHSSNIGFTPTTVSGWVRIVSTMNFVGKRILVAPHEWCENLEVLKQMADHADATVEVLPALDLADPDLSKWQERIDEDVAAIFTPMVTSVSGQLYPVTEIGALERPVSCPLIVDAAQALGQVEIDVPSLNCDFLISTCRKWLRGPRGTAMFWVNPDRQPDIAIVDIEPNDANVALRLGLGIAVKEALDRSIPVIRQRLQALHQYGAKRANDLGLSLFATLPAQTGALTIGIPKEKSATLQARLDAEQIYPKWANARKDEPMADQIRHDVTALRIAAHLYNSTNDLDRLIDVIKDELDR